MKHYRAKHVGQVELEFNHSLVIVLEEVSSDDIDFIVGVRYLRRQGEESTVLYSEHSGRVLRSYPRGIPFRVQLDRLLEDLVDGVPVRDALASTFPLFYGDQDILRS